MRRRRWRGSEEWRPQRKAESGLEMCQKVSRTGAIRNVVESWWRRYVSNCRECLTVCQTWGAPHKTLKHVAKRNRRKRELHKSRDFVIFGREFQIDALRLWMHLIIIIIIVKDSQLQKWIRVLGEADCGHSVSLLKRL